MILDNINVVKQKPFQLN